MLYAGTNPGETSQTSLGAQILYLFIWKQATAVPVLSYEYSDTLLIDYKALLCSNYVFHCFSLEESNDPTGVNDSLGNSFWGGTEDI